MIQIAPLGINALVVKEGLKKALPDKLYILHTKDEVNYKFEKRARALRRKIEKQFKMSTNKNGPEGMRDDIGAKKGF